MSRSARAQTLESGGPLQGYTPAGGSFDELVDGDGAARAHWEPFVRALAALDPTVRALRTEQLNARVRETGIAHDLFSDPASAAQPWRIDLVPLIIAPEEWRFLEGALLQRARLFEALLADLYGPRRLLATGAIPDRLVFSDPSYLRPCYGLNGGVGYLQFFAADLARSPDGRWRVIDTHTETPAGLGYALANRMVHTNVAGDIFATCKAQRLAGFFQQLQAALSRRAGRGDPTIALLSPGPQHSDFFSHAYLARYLGMLLVEGGDLRAAGENVSLKTLHGLMPIDVIVRCIPGAAADPLELDATEFAGPVGLLAPLRRRPGLVVNALGSAVAENRGLGACLPGLARLLLGEELLLPDAPRWWLGDAGNRRHVLAHLDGMVIRPAHEGTARPGGAVPGIDPLRLSRGERAALIEEIEIGGPTLVAEEKIGFGTTPSLTPEGLLPKPYAVRFFAAATSGGFVALPGGLAMTVDPERAVALSAPDGEARDVWVVSAATPPPHVSLWRPTVSAASVQRTVADLPSRAADNLFWLGSYIESADWTMRVLRVCLGRLQEDSAPRQELRASRTALEILHAHDGRVGQPRAPADARLIGQLAHSLMSTAASPNGLPRTLDEIHRVASLARDRLSLEAWRTLNDFYASRRWRADAMPVAIGDALGLLDDGLRVLAAFHGLTHENMTRGFGWSFLDMGRRIARARNLAQLLLGMFARTWGSEEETGSLLFTLELADCFITYRSRYRLAPVLPLVLDLLLVDETNPRSVAFQLSALVRHIDTLPHSGQGSGRVEEQRTALALLTEARLADVERLADSGSEGARAALGAVLEHQNAALPGLADALGRRYFNVMEKDAKWVRSRSRVIE
jgi:uncharacterized circularly permuted ATP-grasp superfamily protein/uncharacterized alpha-E superfamily protein